MAFRELTAPTLTELFINELEGMILSGELKTGERLPPERELAAKMKVSQAVINAGIRELDSRGFLRIVPRQGVFVADYIRDGNIHTMKAILEHTGGPLDPDIEAPLCQFRRALEVPTCRAAANRTPEHLETISAVITQAQSEEDPARFADLCFQFHHEVAIASGNMYYPMIIQSCRPLYQFFYRHYFNSQTRDAVTTAMSSLRDAIREGEAAKAAAIADQMIDRWAKQFEKKEAEHA